MAHRGGYPRGGRATLLPVIALAAALAFGAATATAHEDEEDHQKAPAAAEANDHGNLHDTIGGLPGRKPMGVTSGMRNLMMPRMDSAKGRKLFASKGCVTCHSVNGVGGHDAKAFDAHEMTPLMNPFDLAAKMWRMAPIMIDAQEEALGEQILFTGEELGDIIAFLHDDTEQHKFSEDDIPARIRPMMHHVHGTAGGGAEAHEKELGHEGMRHQEPEGMGHEGHEEGDDD